MSQRRNQPRLVVIGAGAFGGWTALELRRRGALVTLIDAWGPGHARASSGGETRIIRATYGTRAVYTKMALRALELWRAHDRGRRLLRETGVLWMFGDDDSFGHASAQVLRDHGAWLDRLTLSEASRRYPQVNFDGIGSVFVEPDAGYLFARRACEDVAEHLIAEGGEYRQATVVGPIVADETGLPHVVLEDGTRLEADAFVFACGPWLPALFPDVVGANITATRQEVFYFGTPAGDSRFTGPELPVWISVGSRESGVGSLSRQSESPVPVGSHVVNPAAGHRLSTRTADSDRRLRLPTPDGRLPTVIYGIPADGPSGFKVADDAPGPAIDPTSGDREVSVDGVARARAFLSRRFPALADAPLVDSEVCQYESTPDDHFIVDRHPVASNVWIVGGGSGHGFKMGPAVGETVASIVLSDSLPDPQFSLARFVAAPHGGWEKKWS